jgi:hypothetical protein
MQITATETKKFSEIKNDLPFGVVGRLLEISTGYYRAFEYFE